MLRHPSSSNADAHRIVFRTDFDDVVSTFKADDAVAIHNFPTHLKSLASLYSTIYVDIPGTSSGRSSRSPKSLLRYLFPPAQTHTGHESVEHLLPSSRRRPLAPLVAKLRTIKSEHEQAVMRAAADISGHALAKVTRVLFLTRQSVTRASLNRKFSRRCSSRVPASRRARSLRTLSTVALLLAHRDRPTCLSLHPGTVFTRFRRFVCHRHDDARPNALIIHYTSNNQIVRDGEMVLMDAGCAYK